MNMTRRLVSVVLAMILVLCVATSAMAADNSITVNNAQGGETYKIYKMMDLVTNDAMTAYAYTINEAWEAFFDEGGAGAEYVVIDELGYVTWADGKDSAEAMEAFGKLASAYADDKTAQSITPDTDGSVVFDELDAGYYLITSTNGNLVIIDTTPTNPNPEINEKNPNPGVVKEVQEDSTEKWGEENSAQIGDTVEFKAAITVEKGAKNYVMHDQMDEALDYVEGSVAIEGLTKGADYTVNEGEACTDDCDFEIVFAQNYLDTITAQGTLIVTYEAILTEAAKIDTAIENDVKLSWGENNETEWDTTVTKTYKFSVLKYAEGDAEKNPLAGATFQLKNAEGNVVKLVKISDTEYRVANGNEEDAVDSFTTVGSGEIVITGVDLDPYTLVETAAPAGYNLLKDPVNVTVEASNALIIEVENKTGAELPETGGMGTTLFYVVGGVLVVAAFILLVTKRRVGTEK